MRQRPYLFITLGTCLAVILCSLFVLGIYLTAAR